MSDHPKCPLGVVEWDCDEKDMPKAFYRICGADLYLNWAYSVPIEYADESTGHDDVPNLAVSSSWRLECTEGHALAASDGSQDCAEPFDSEIVLGAVIP